MVAYHDSCQGLNALGLSDAPRRILGEVLGHEVRDLAESRVCCGFGGSFSFDYPRISERLMNRKLDDAEATGALEIVTDNQGCIMQLRGGSDAQGRPLEVHHLAELVAEGVDAARERLRGGKTRSLPPSPASMELMAPRPLDPRPKAVLFDLDDTLCDYAAAREARLRRAFTLAPDGGIQPREAIDLDLMIAESIRMHPHGADHFPELFMRFGIGDAGEAQAAADWYRKNRFHSLRLFPEV